MTNKPEDNKNTENTENPETSSSEGPENLDDLFKGDEDKYAELDALFEDDEDEDEEYTLEDYIEENAAYIAQYQKAQEINVNLKNENVRLEQELAAADHSVDVYKHKTINELADGLSTVTASIDVLINDKTDDAQNDNEKLDNMKQGLVLTQVQFKKIFNEAGVGGKHVEQTTTATVEKAVVGDIPTAPSYDSEKESEQEIMIKFIQANSELAKQVNQFSCGNSTMMRQKSQLTRQIKRIGKVNEDKKQQAIKKFATSLLDVADNLERATQYLTQEERQADGAMETLAQNIEGAASDLQKVFNQFGVEKMQVQGTKFDPNYHEALTMMPANDVEKDHVAAVMQEGYTLHGKLLRPARVGVAQ